MELIKDIAIPLITLLFGAFVYFLKKDLENNKKATDKANEKAAQIEVNYLKRFDMVHDRLNLAEKNIIATVHELKLLMVQNYMTKEDCEKYHNKIGV